MTLKIRRILSLIFFVLFIVIAPLIILYAAGYKLKSGGFSVERTGMFIIDSRPEGAKIFLNGQAQKTWFGSLFNQNGFIATPASLKNLLPGRYDLSLELNGYFGWNKKLTISPGASTLAQDIYLFKNNLPALIASFKIQAINFSPDKTQAAIITAGQLTLFNLANQTEESVSQNYLNGKNIAWSSDGRRLIIDNYLYNTGDLGARVDLGQLTAGSFNYKWSNNNLFYQDKTSIYQLDNNNLPKKIIDNANFSDYLVKNGNLYLISLADQTASLVVIDLSAGDKTREIGLPALASYSFINPEQGLLNLYDNDHKTLYLIDPPAAYYSPFRETINNIKTAIWYDSDNLIYANDFEIWLYRLSSKEKTLITRISDNINNIVMHQSKNYIIYSTAKTINAIELDDRDKRNTAELAKFNLIGPFSLNSRGNVLYLSGRFNGAEGLYKLVIQ